jgi:hypothetical protein
MDEPRDASVEEMTFNLAEVAHTDDRRMMMGSVGAECSPDTN